MKVIITQIRVLQERYADKMDLFLNYGIGSETIISINKELKGLYNKQ